MTRVKPSELRAGEEEALLKTLSQAIAQLQGEKEISLFLAQLLTRSEGIMIARRVRIATLLLAGESYEGIKMQTGAGATTISGVQKWIDAEGQQCSKEVMQSLEGKYEKSHKKEQGRGSPTRDLFNDMRQRYPLQFLLFNLFIEHKSKKN